MRRLLVTLMISSLMPIVLFAQEQPEFRSKEEYDQKVDVIATPVGDIEARYLARDVRQGLMPYDYLVGYIKRWFGTDKMQEKMFGKVMQYVSSPDVIVISQQELKQLNDNKYQRRQLRNKIEWPDEKDRILNKKIRKIEEPVLELEARYWAHCIAVKHDFTFEELRGRSFAWIGDPQYTDQLIDKIQENIQTGNTEALTPSERAQFDKAQNRVWKLLNRNKK